MKETLRPFSPLRIVLDPGHGGDREGTRGPKGTLEKAVNLKVARIFSQRLRSRGLDVVLTREEDVHLSLEDRVAIDGDIWISIHHNATATGPPPTNRGEFYVPLARPHPSWELAREIIEAFQEDPRWPFPPYPQPLPATYRVLVPDRVTLLTEACYLNHAEGERFLNEEGIHIEAELLEKGLLSFLKRTEGRIPRVIHTERRGNQWTFVVDGPVEPSSLRVCLNDHPLDAMWDGSQQIQVQIPQNWPGGRWMLSISFTTPEGVPSLPFQVPVTLSRPIQSFHITAYPLAYRVPSYVILRMFDTFGNPAPPGLKTRIRLRDGTLMAQDVHTRPGGEVHCVVDLPKGSGVIEVDLPGFSGVGQLTYQERTSYQYGRIVHAHTQEPIPHARIRMRGKTFTPFADGWFFIPGREEMVIEARGYKSLRLQEGKGQTVGLEPLLGGLFHKSFWVEGPSLIRVLAFWLSQAGADVHSPPEGTSEVDRVFAQNQVSPSWTLIFERGETSIGYFPGIPSQQSEEPARRLAHTLHSMGYKMEVRPLSSYCLIQYTGPRVVVRHPDLDPSFLHAFFAAFLHLLGGPSPWHKVVRAVQKGRGVEGVTVQPVDYPAWNRTGTQGYAHLWLPDPDLPLWVSSPDIHLEIGDPVSERGGLQQ